MLLFEEALKLVLDEARHINPSVISLPLLDSLNQILAEDVFSDTDLPCFTNSSMDGFAIRYSDNNSWSIIDEIPAGHFHKVDVDIAGAVRIMTGGKLPENADTVIPIEDVDESETKVFLKQGVQIRPGQFVRHSGEDLLSNSLSVSKNTLLEPRHLALLAMCGKDTVRVSEPLKIGVMTTGDELIDINQKPVDDKVRASNLYTILAALKKLNMRTRNIGIINDDKVKIKDAVSAALNSDLDILITTGGVSVGKYDYLKDVFRELGVEVFFNSVKIKPGKPVVFGKYQNGNEIKYVFGLPGNPVSSYATFRIFIEPFLQKVFGQSTEQPTKAILRSKYTKADAKRHFIRGILSRKDNVYYATIQGKQSSNNLAGLAQSNCLILANEDVNTLNVGDEVQCIRI